MLFGKLFGLPHMLLLLLAVIIHIWDSPRRKRFLLRSVLSIVACAAFYLPVFFLSPLIQENRILNTVLQAAWFVVIVLLSLVLFEQELHYSVCRCMYGYLTYTNAYIVGKLLITLSRAKGLSYDILMVLSYLIVYGVYTYFSFRKKRGKKHAFEQKTRVFLVLLLIGMSFSFIWFPYPDSTERYLLPAFVWIVYLGFALLTFFADEKQLSNEKVLLEQLLKKEAQQYELSKELIESINLKAHDLKHQIRHLNNGEAQINETVLREIEATISDYDAGYKTGNEALDIIITEKSRQGNRSGIRIACVADGEKLSFIEPKDVYSLVGNLLDNAIEATSALPDDEMRTINFSVHEEFGLVHIRTENYFAGAILFDGQLPLTAKSDKQNHGFGTKSIRAIAEKYDGLAEFFTDQNVFVASVVIPYSGSFHPITD